MKKLLNIAAVICSVSVIAALTLSARSATADKGEKSIPDNVLKIAQKSCVKCHSKPGESLALKKVNLGEWDKLSPGKQAEKAQKMCDMVTKEKMPPNKFRKSNPNDLPTKEEIAIICDWAQSLKADNK
jgi:hypothetical protein